MWPALQTCGDVTHGRLGAAEVCCTTGCFDASMDHALCRLPVLLAVNPQQPFQLHRLLCMELQLLLCSESGQTPSAMLVRSLWRMFDISARLLIDIIVTCSRWQFSGPPAGQQEQTLCVLPFEHTVAALSQALKSPALRWQGGIACSYWQPSWSPASISLVVSAGALPLVVAYLEHGTGSVYAVRALQEFCSCTTDIYDDHADLLARLQGVRRLSNIMCPVQPSKAGSKVAGMAPTAIIWTAVSLCASASQWLVL